MLLRLSNRFLADFSRFIGVMAQSRNETFEAASVKKCCRLGEWITLSKSSTVVSSRPLGGVCSRLIGGEEEKESEVGEPAPTFDEDSTSSLPNLAFSFENPVIRSKRVPLPGGSLPMQVGVVMADMVSSGEQLTAFIVT